MSPEREINPEQFWNAYEKDVAAVQPLNTPCGVVVNDKQP
jgi:hypothetical protein